MILSGQSHLLLDVREDVEYDICHLPHSRSIPPTLPPHTILHSHTHTHTIGLVVLAMTPMVDISLKKLKTGSLELAWQWILEATPTTNDLC